MVKFQEELSNLLVKNVGQFLKLMKPNTDVQISWHMCMLELLLIASVLSVGIKHMRNKENIQAMLKEALERADLLMRPYILFIHPELKKELLKQIPNLEKLVVVKESELLERDKAYLVEREEIEKWTKPNIGGYFDETIQYDIK